MVASLVFGGATRAGFLSDMILQVVAVPALIILLWKAYQTPLAKPAQVGLAFCLALLAVPLIQLISLPPWLWTALPNRAASASVLELLGQPIRWRPLSTAQNATWLSVLSLLPPFVIFLGTLLLGFRERRALSLVVIAMGVVSVFLGLLQIAQGPESSLRFFEITNNSEAVGFFANRNHFAALLYAAALFAVAWAVSIAAWAGPAAARFEVGAIVRLIGIFTILVVLLSGQAMARSRAGIGLTIIALFGAFALALPAGRSSRTESGRLSDKSGTASAKLLIGAITLSIIFTAQYALFRILERFDADPLEDARLGFFHNTVAAARAFMPFGSGLGSFVSVYGQFETPQTILANTFANHAHNDIVELWLETGIFGIALMALFFVWFIWRSFALWRDASRPGYPAIDGLLRRAATIVTALLIAHCFVDYPLRTGAVMAVMAFTCALLFDPPVGAERAAPAAAQIKEVDSERAQDRRRRRLRESAPAASSGLASPERPPTGARWGTDVDWPEAWRRPVQSPPRPDDGAVKPPKWPKN